MLGDVGALGHVHPPEHAFAQDAHQPIVVANDVAALRQRVGIGGRPGLDGTRPTASQRALERDRIDGAR
jgi:hypothetical protein